MRAVSLFFCLVVAAHAAEPDLGPTFSGTIRARLPAPQTTMKGVVVTLDPEKKTYICYDTDLMRVSLAWTGEFLRFGNYLKEIVHPQPPEVTSQPLFSTKPGPGWTKDGSLADTRPNAQGPLPRDHAKYRGLYMHAGQIVFSYTVGKVGVLEMPSIEYVEGQPVFVRTLQFDKECPESLLVCDLSDALTINVSGGVLEKKDGKALVKPSGKSVRVSIASHANTPKAEVQDLASLIKGGPARWPEPVTTQVKPAANANAPYVVDTLSEPVPNPWGAQTFFGGFDFLPDGRAAICTFHGDVWIVSGLQESELTWKRFATGLFQPLGLKVVDGKIYVTGRDQLTRLHDLNNDGEADFYECFNNDTVVTANYHEFCMDLHTDTHGTFYYAKGAPWPPDSKSSPHHGCVLKVSPDGAKLAIHATGFRAPNGLGMGPNNELTTSDNEGHYMPAGKLNWVKSGGFYGMVQTAHRTPKPTTFDQPICWLPKNMDNSGGGQVWVTSDKWGPLKDHLLYMSYGRATLLHVMHEEVDGQIQAAMTQFPFKFNTGVMRARFNPRDGQLYLCGLRGWQTDGLRSGGFYRVRYTGKPVHMASELYALKNGFRITFTSPLDETSAASLDSYSMEQWNYKWTPEYGSPEFSVSDPTQKKHDPVVIKSAKLLADKRTVFLEIPDIQPVNQYKVKVKITAADGSPISQDIYGTIHRLGNGQNLSLAR
jgi:hypothetical protein